MIINDNCLCYALRFWNNNPEYKLWYNSDHVINSDSFISNPTSLFTYLPITDYGYEYFIKAFKDHLDDYHLGLLKKYFYYN